MNKVTFKGWVARDKDGDINFFIDRPKRSICAWTAPICAFLERGQFPEITWENEPVEKTLTIE